MIQCPTACSISSRASHKRGQGEIFRTNWSRARKRKELNCQRRRNVQTAVDPVFTQNVFYWLWIQDQLFIESWRQDLIETKKVWILFETSVPWNYGDSDHTLKLSRLQSGRLHFVAIVNAVQRKTIVKDLCYIWLLKFFICPRTYIVACELYIHCRSCTGICLLQPCMHMVRVGKPLRFQDLRWKPRWM